MPGFPIYSESLHLEQDSINYLRLKLPDRWLLEKPENDFGIDQRILIVTESGEVTGLELLVQLKATHNTTGCISHDKVKIKGFKTSTYRYLKSQLSVVMIIKYISSKNSAYWIYLKDIPEPNLRLKTFSISISIENNLNTIDWTHVKQYLLDVSTRKLAANQ